MRIFLAVGVISSLAFLAGCASGLHPLKVDELMGASEFKGEKADALGGSFGRTAVWMNIETMNSDGELEPLWKWSKTDLGICSSYMDTLVKEKTMSGYYFVKTSELESRDLDGVLKKAAEGTDSVIMIRTVVEADKYFNPVAILDLTILGAYWFPGSNRDAYAKTRVELVDLKTKRLLLSCKGEGRMKVSKPTFMIDTEEVVSKAKSDSLRNALREFFKTVSTRTNIVQW